MADHAHRRRWEGLAHCLPDSFPRPHSLVQEWQEKRDNQNDIDDVDGAVAAEAVVAADASTTIDLPAVPPTPPPPPQPNLDEECDAVMESLYGEAMVYDGLPKCVFPCHY